MRIAFSAAVVVALALSVVPREAAAWVVIRHPVFIAPMPVVVAPAPVVVVAPPAYVVPPPPPPPPPAALPINTTMWTLPPGCVQVSVVEQPYFRCGPNWMRPIASDRGTYFAVVPSPL